VLDTFIKLYYNIINMNKNKLLDEMKKLSSQIMKAKISGQPQGKLRQEFAKLQKQYKVLWAKDFNKSEVSII
jgi:uncharacterized membrane protein